MSTTTAGGLTSREIFGYKILFFGGLFLVPLGIFLSFFHSYQRHALIHPSEPRYRFECIDLEFEPSGENYQTQTTLLLTDRGSDQTFEKFRKELSSRTVYLQLLQRDGTSKGLRAVAVDGLDEIRSYNQTATVRVDFEMTAWDDIWDAKLFLHFGDFPPVKIESTNTLLPFFGGGETIWLSVIGGFLSIVTGFMLYEPKPATPKEPVAAPIPLNLTKNEPWRKRTDFRFLEAFKEYLIRAEESAEDAHRRAVEAHQQLSNGDKGFVQDKLLRSRIRREVEKVNSQLKTIAEQKEHIEQLFAGDVKIYLQEYEEAAEKIKSANKDAQIKLQDVERKIANTNDKESLRSLESEKQLLRTVIEKNNKTAIENQSVIKELREFDFQKLYQELGVSPEVMRTNLDQLKKIEAKKNVADKIKPSPPAAVEPTNAERRAKIEEQIKAIEKEIEEILNRGNIRQEEKIREINVREAKLHTLRVERLDYL